MRLSKRQWRVFRAVLDRTGPYQDHYTGLWMSAPGVVYAMDRQRLVRFSKLDLPRAWEDGPEARRAIYSVDNTGTQIVATPERSPIDHCAMLERSREKKRSKEPKIPRIFLDGRLLDVVTLAAKCTPINKLYSAHTVFAGELGEVFFTIEYLAEWRFDIFVAPCRE